MVSTALCIYIPESTKSSHYSCEVALGRDIAAAALRGYKIGPRVAKPRTTLKTAV